MMVEFGMVDEKINVQNPYSRIVIIDQSYHVFDIVCMYFRTHRFRYYFGDSHLLCLYSLREYCELDIVKFLHEDEFALIVVSS